MAVINLSLGNYNLFYQIYTLRYALYKESSLYHYNQSFRKPPLVDMFTSHPQKVITECRLKWYKILNQIK